MGKVVLVRNPAKPLGLVSHCLKGSLLRKWKYTCRPCHWIQCVLRKSHLGIGSWWSRCCLMKRSWMRRHFWQWWWWILRNRHICMCRSYSYVFVPFRISHHWNSWRLQGILWELDDNYIYQNPRPTTAPAYATSFFPVTAFLPCTPYQSPRKLVVKISMHHRKNLCCTSKISSTN